MKYIKTYEDLHAEPQIGDYVICNDKVSHNKRIENFCANNIGILKNIRISSPDQFDVYYENMPPSFNIRNNNRKLFNEDEIIYHSKNKKDLEIYIATKKYNI